MTYPIYFQYPDKMLGFAPHVFCEKRFARCIGPAFQISKARAWALLGCGKPRGWKCEDGRLGKSHRNGQKARSIGRAPMVSILGLLIFDCAPHD